jgi:LysR family transcriptional activator of nhaA
MEWLNYHHLLYFWTVAREGTVAGAAATLSLTQPTVSGQVRALEEALGEKLFTRSGRRLVLTEMGQLVFRYADEIFSLGNELLDAVKDRPTGRPMRLMVGVADALSKLIAHRVLEPATALADRVHIVCREGRPDRLLADLSAHTLDLVLSDAPMPPASGVRAFNHLLGECGVTIFATGRQARTLRQRFPQALHGAAFLLPSENTVLRRGLDQWFNAQGIRVSVSGEFDDSALMNVFGQAGAGAFAAPSVVEQEVSRQYGVAIVGRIEAIRERCYAITMDRKIKHPAVAAVAETARTRLFEVRKSAFGSRPPDRTYGTP